MERNEAGILLALFLRDLHFYYFLVGGALAITPFASAPQSQL
jgi:hypothetical protein